MEPLKEHIGTEKGNFTGLIQIDFISGEKLADLCRDCLIDVGNRTIVGFGASFEEPVSANMMMNCRLLTVDKKFGNTNAKIQEGIKKNNGHLKIEKLFFKASLSTLSKHLQNIDFLMISDALEGIKIIDVEKDTYQWF